MPEKSGERNNKRNTSYEKLQGIDNCAIELDVKDNVNGMTPCDVIILSRTNQNRHKNGRVQINDSSKEKGIIFEGVTAYWVNDKNDQKFGNFINILFYINIGN